MCTLLSIMLKCERCCLFAKFLCISVILKMYYCNTRIINLKLKLKTIQIAFKKAQNVLNIYYYISHFFNFPRNEQLFLKKGNDKFSGSTVKMIIRLSQKSAFDPSYKSFHKNMNVKIKEFLYSLEISILEE